jgi:hypothetical protein
LQVNGAVAVLVSAALLVVTRTASGQTQVPNCEISVVDGARMNNNSSSAAGLSASAVDGRLQLGRRVEFADHTSVSGAFVGLGNGASVFDVNANELKLGRGAIVHGVKGPFVSDGATCELQNIVCGGQSVFLRRGDAPRTLSPGTYGAVNLENGTSLTLAPGGVYTFCSIKTGRHVQLTVAGTSQSTINVAGSVDLGNATTFGPSNGTPTPLLNVAGDSVHVGGGSKVRAFITAPHARLSIGKASTLTGAACARSFGSGRNVSVVCAPDQATPTTTTSSPSTSTTSTTATTSTSSTHIATTTTTTVPGPTTTTTVASTTTSTTTAPASTTTTAVVTTSTSSTQPPPTTSSTTSSSTSSTVVPTTTTTTTTVQAFTRFSFTNSAGSTNCGGITGGVTFTPPAGAPFSGEIDSDVTCTTKITDLGLGCLYIGGGGATTVPPGATPNGATNLFEISGNTLSASSGTSHLDCTKGAGPGKHCIGGPPQTGNACNADADCGGLKGSCALDANCFFAAPLPIPNGSLSTCVINVIQTDASGIGDLATGVSAVNIPLSSRVFITSNSASPCPKCVSGTCTYGPGTTCTVGNNTLGTSQDCPPNPANFLAPLAVSLNPLTTGVAQKTGVAGAFCTPQRTNGAFGKTAAQCIKETGSPGGDLTDGQPHPSKLASAFCIPATGNVAIDPAADLPGPGAFSITGNAQALP